MLHKQDFIQVGLSVDLELILEVRQEHTKLLQSTVNTHVHT